MNAFIEKIKQHPLFQKFASHPDPESPFGLYEYIMRKDGVLMFPVSVLADKEKRTFICVEPVRFPGIKNYKGLAKNEIFFGQPFLSIMKIFSDGTMKNSQEIQELEMQKILEAHKGALMPLQKMEVYAGSIEYPENIVAIFNGHKALQACLELNSQAVKKVIKWLKENTDIKEENLGLTGSTALAKIDARDEDVDIIIRADIDKLNQVKLSILNGIAKGIYKPVHEFGKTWPLRIYLDETVELCPFFDIIEGGHPLYEAHFKILKREIKLKAIVEDDTYNMVSPIILKIKVLKSSINLNNIEELIINNTFNRGDFQTGDIIEITNCSLCEINSQTNKIYRALLVTDWNVTEKVLGIDIKSPTGAAKMRVRR